MPLHVLFLHVGAERYALASACVVEVVPDVPLRTVPGVPAWVAGLLDYRGRVLPVVDLGARVGASPAPRLLSTRVVVCDPEGALRPFGAELHGDVGRRLVGLRAERVLDLGTIDPHADGSHAGARAPELEALGRVTRDERGLVQLVTVGDLITPAHWSLLEREESPTSASGGAGGSAGPGGPA